MCAFQILLGSCLLWFVRRSVTHLQLMSTWSKRADSKVAMDAAYGTHWRTFVDRKSVNQNTYSPARWSW